MLSCAFPLQVSRLRCNKSWSLLINNASGSRVSSGLFCRLSSYRTETQTVTDRRSGTHQDNQFPASGFDCRGLWSFTASPGATQSWILNSKFCLLLMLLVPASRRRKQRLCMRKLLKWCWNNQRRPDTQCSGSVLRLDSEVMTQIFTCSILCLSQNKLH